MPDNQQSFSEKTVSQASFGIDERARRTRKALHDAFDAVVRANGNTPVRASQVIEMAGVGRSTFYDHFHGMDDLRLEAFTKTLAILADGLTGRADQSDLLPLLDHFWRNRSRKREFLSGQMGRRARHALIVAVASRLTSEEPERTLEAISRSGAALALLNAWLEGRVGASSSELGSFLASRSIVSQAKTTST